MKKYFKHQTLADKKRIDLKIVLSFLSGDFNDFFKFEDGTWNVTKISKALNVSKKQIERGIKKYEDIKIVKKIFLYKFIESNAIYRKHTPPE
jgi:predicted transcriptional regulator